MTKTKSKLDKKQILAALDLLALALVDHDHQWTYEERRHYEEAVAALSE